MRCRKVRRILRYYVPNKLLPPEKFAHHVILLFFLFRDEKLLLSGCPLLYQEQGVQDVVNRNKIKFESYGEQAFSQFNENSINNQDPHNQIQNNQTSEAKYANQNDSENIETNKTSAIRNFMSQILPDNEIAKGINSLNSKQREVFNVIHTWDKNYVKYNGHDVEPVTYFSQVVEGKVNLIWRK